MNATLENLGSLITYEQDGKRYCLGYLFDFTGHGIFSPDGKVEVTKEQADTHNRLLAEGELKGLDENCQVGMHGTFYFIGGKVQTWTGVLVSERVILSPGGRGITFYRNGKTYRGRLPKDADCFNFKRIK